ncbi:hypothetical protein Pfo_009234 [Paulownia fortunei]|nr:hypothetical protein Pfo_009234 [Paulownia fortunei]
MKMRNKGKVHPFTSSSSSSSSSSSYTPNEDSFSVLKLLPAAIFTLVSVISLEDREVLAYMITRSLKSTNPSFFPAKDKKKCPKKQSFDFHGHNSPALFDCDCFDCYTSFWFRWDSSPNRELIHQAIEAFEEHLNNGEREQFKRSGNGKNKRKEKMGRRKGEKMSADGVVLEISTVGPAKKQESLVVASLEKDVATAEADNMEPGCREREEEEEEEEEEDVAASPASVVVHNHKGLVRKVLSDVMGIFNSRLWSFWSPNV